MTAPTPPKYRLPAHGPSPADIADRDLWEKASDASLSSVQAAAEKWRTGLAAFVTLVTGGLLIKGPEAAKDLSTDWLIALTVLGGGGLLLAVSGLWQALRAAAGVPAGLRYEDVVAKYTSFRQFQVAAAKTAAKTLATARWLVGGSLLLLGATLIVWWWTPSESGQLVSVTHGDATVCGTLKSADDQTFVIQVAGESTPTAVAFGDAENVRIVGEC